MHLRGQQVPWPVKGLIVSGRRVIEVLQKQQNPKKRFSRFHALWLNTSISLKTTLLQVVLVGVPILVCLIVFYNYMTFDALRQNVQKSYEYGRYVVDSFEAEMLRIKSIANVIQSNSTTMALLTSDEGSYSDSFNLLVSSTANVHNKVARTAL